MPVILVTEPGEEIISKVGGINEGFPEYTGPRTWCLFLNQSALATEGSSPSVLQCVPLNLTNEELEEIRWYLEDYAQQDPFERSRAEKAKTLLLSYGRNLASAINWTELIRPDERKERLVLKVLALDEDMHHVFWEILEHPEVWSPVAPPAVHVLRVESTAEDGESETIQEPEVQNESESCNILVVAARPDSDDDIPHRLVSRILHDMIHDREDEFPRPVSMEIVRPATWEAFQDHLESHPAGYFSIVHFDMHGLEDNEGRTRLVFVKPKSGNLGNFQPDHIASAEVAAVLARHKVDQVVLNACRSAKGRKAERNAALSIIRAGIRFCVAMSYSIVARAVEIFMAVLYDALLVKNLSLDAATSMARAALSIHPERLSGFGETVLVDDWVVPIVYGNSSFSWKAKYTFSRKFSIPDGSYFNQPPVGRESDIVRIESGLLIAQRPVLLIGQAGIGKTCLLEHLGRWWRDTGLVVGVHCIQFSRIRTWDLHGIYSDLHQKFFGHTSSESHNAVLSHLRSIPFLLIFDSLESIEFSQYSTKRKLYRELPRFLQSLCGGKTLVIIASRANEDWLSQQTVTHFLGSIGTMAGMQYIRRVIDGAHAEMELPKYESLEDCQYLEQIFKLVNGNPMALTLVLTDYLRSLKRPQDYLYHLLSGQPMEFGKEKFEAMESFRSLAELGAITDSLVPKDYQSWLPGQILAPFWKVLPENDLRLYAACYNRKVSQRAESIFGLSGSSCGEKTRQILAFLQTISDLTGESIDDYTNNAGFELLRTAAEVPPEEEESQPKLIPALVNVDGLFLALEEFDLDEFVKTPFLDLLDSQCTRILEPLKKSLFLTKPGTLLLPGNVQSKDYLLIHPILPIVLRAHPAYQQNLFKLAEGTRLGFSFYYMYRAKKWPFQYIYFNPIWDEYRKAIEIEFINFLSAAACYLQDCEDVKCVRYEQSFLMRMLMVLHRGIGSDFGRITIVQALWEKALDACLEQESALVAQRPSKSMAERFTELFLSSSSDEAQSADEGKELREYQETFLFSVRLYALQASWAISIGYRHLNSTKQTLFQKIAERLIRDLIRDGIPSEVNAEYWKRLLDYYLYISTVAMRPGADMVEMFAKRQGHIKQVTEYFGVESFPQDQTSWHALPMDLLAKSSHSSRIVTAVVGIRRAIKQDRLSEAREMLDKVLKMEMFEASNDLANKATLLKLRAEIHEKKGEWEDALRNYDEAYKLEEEAAERHGKTMSEGLMERFERELKRQILLGKISESKTGLSK